jgi:hypothetical protein
VILAVQIPTMEARPMKVRTFLAAVGRLFAMVIAAAACCATPALGQMGGMMGGGGGMMGGGGGMMGGGGGMMGGGGGMMGGGGGMMGGGGGMMGGGVGGVFVDANGVLQNKTVRDAGLAAEHRQAALAPLPGDLRKASKLRKVALSRMEAKLLQAAAAGKGIPQEFLTLAGLTRIQYVFVYPAADGRAGEIVVAGPAEPWFVDANGRVRGLDTGSPTLLASPPASRRTGCSAARSTRPRRAWPRCRTSSARPAA